MHPLARASDHPALGAWMALTGTTAQAEVEVVHLKSKREGSVYRIIESNPVSTTLIAKRAHRRKGTIEHGVYKAIGSEDSMGSVEYYGCVEEAGTPYLWLFLEDVGDERYSPASAEDRALAATWLGALQVTIARTGAMQQFPERGPDFFQLHLKSLMHELPAIRTRSRLPQDIRRIIQGIESLCEHLAKHWIALDEFCAPVPRTLIHGDCLRKNVHVRRTSGAPEIAFFDWGGAGRGLAATDLGLLGLPAQGPPGFDPGYAPYIDTVRELWTDVEPGLVRQLAQIGQLFWVLKVIHKSLPDLDKPLPHVVDNFRLYGAALHRSLSETIWAPPPSLESAQFDR